MDLNFIYSLFIELRREVMPEEDLDDWCNHPDTKHIGYYTPRHMVHLLRTEGYLCWDYPEKGDVSLSLMGITWLEQYEVMVDMVKENVMSTELLESFNMTDVSSVYDLIQMQVIMNQGTDIKDDEDDEEEELVLPDW